MPLSEGEQRRLDEIERAMKLDDPKFAATITIEHFRRQHAVVAAVFLALGMIGSGWTRRHRCVALGRDRHPGRFPLHGRRRVLVPDPPQALSR